MGCAWTGWRSDAGPGGEVCAGREKGWNLEGDGGRRGGIWALTEMGGVGYELRMRRVNSLSSDAGYPGMIPRRATLTFEVTLVQVG